MKLLWVVAGLLAVGAAVVGCGHAAGSGPAPVATPTPPASSETPAAGAPSTPLAPPTGTAGSDGLTVRYADADGSIKTLRVEDFRR